MKNQYFIVFTIGLFLVSSFIGCNINREQKVENAKTNLKEAEQDLKDAQAQYENDWQQFKAKVELKISVNEKSIDTLKTEIKTASKKFRTRYEKEVLALEIKNNGLKKKIAEYKYDGKDKWEEFKRAFDIDVNIVGTAVKDLFTKKSL